MTVTYSKSVWLVHMYRPHQHWTLRYYSFASLLLSLNLGMWQSGSLTSPSSRPWTWLDLAGYFRAGTDRTRKYIPWIGDLNYIILPLFAGYYPTPLLRAIIQHSQEITGPWLVLIGCLPLFAGYSPSPLLRTIIQHSPGLPPFVITSIDLGIRGSNIIGGIRGGT